MQPVAPTFPRLVPLDYQPEPRLVPCGRCFRGLPFQIAVEVTYMVTGTRRYYHAECLDGASFDLTS
jgi:hypothetical protein